MPLIIYDPRLPEEQRRRVIEEMAHETTNLALRPEFSELLEQMRERYAQLVADIGSGGML